jgi:hypothetical protein
VLEHAAKHLITGAFDVRARRPRFRQNHDMAEADEAEARQGPRDHLELLDALGGPQGIADSSVPSLAFVIAYTLGGNDLALSIWIAIAIGVVIAVIRVVRRDPVQFALIGFAGVALAAFIADRTGKAEDFFVPGLLLNAAYALAYLVSIAVRRPLIGLIIGPLTGEGMEWRNDPERVRLYSRASWIWVGVFTLRLAVQLPLYFAGALLALGIAKTAMGLPIFLVAIYLTYLVLRSGPLASPAQRSAAERP